VRIERYDKIEPTRLQREAFASGEPLLDRWLVHQAPENQARRFSVTYLLMDDDVIAGYFSLAAGRGSRAEAPAAVFRRAPEPVPVIRMGRFAIDVRHQGQGWGAELLGRALLHAVSGSRQIGARALLVDAISEDAAAFYRRFGFEPSPIHPLQLLHDLRAVEASTGAGEG
jgi:GNAT superfamily N-acetyltransferase